MRSRADWSVVKPPYAGYADDMSNEQVLRGAEALVRDIFTNVFRQRVSAATVRAVALKVAKALPPQRKGQNERSL